MKINEVFMQSLKIRDMLKRSTDFSQNPIDDDLLPVLPYRTSNKIKLIILGQDPTVKTKSSRENIEYTLNLDRNGALKIYINNICNNLEVAPENIYATNIFKYFYTDPPQGTQEVLEAHLPLNLELLKEELSAYPKAKIFTLGLPVLQLLAGPDAQVNEFWDYKKKTGESGKKFKVCKATDNKLERKLFPFPHQPSSGRKLYSKYFSEYCKFVAIQRR